MRLQARFQGDAGKSDFFEMPRGMGQCCEAESKPKLEQSSDKVDMLKSC